MALHLQAMVAVVASLVAVIAAGSTTVQTFVLTTKETT
jgi:hypothetical protein